jgi:hypothetical protein
MGLITQARQVLDRPEDNAKKKSGLLDHIRLKSSYDSILEAFRNLLNEAGYERGGILFPSPDGIPVFLFASGLDLTSVQRFCVPIQQISPSGESTAWLRFSGEKLDVFSSYFSSREFESLVAVDAHPVSIDGIEAVVVLVDSLLDIRRNKENPEIITKQMENLSGLLVAHRNLLVAISRVASINQSRSVLVNHVKSAIGSGKKASLVRLSLGSLSESPEALACDTDAIPVYSAIMHQIARQIGSANLMHVRADFSANIVLFSSVPIDTSLYFHQILKPLESGFGVQRVSRIVVSESGTSSDIRETTDFLLGER